MYKQSAPKVLSYSFMRRACSHIGFTQTPAAIRRSMGSSHEERTATEPRGKNSHKVILQKIENVNENIRLIRLEIPDQNIEARRPTANLHLQNKYT